ncbi:ribonuclease domain-containing protein [Paenibacillus hunanensis]|uniref:ribonuclease n=1 Tax=Paenibacillus hunanensis TaxID=539262 RepID=UPI002A6B70AE|nr:ribonuclease domain-containing protein [Paenibacillus hunanensis]WPP39992.1 ribonuclease domain-containing protein [Paenibacillus hunanensis]
MKRFWSTALLAMMLVVVFFAGSQAVPAANTHKASAASCTIINTFDGVANYLAANGKLPCNYITKSQASSLGWVSSKGNLADVAPGKSIGGDTFSNREGLLPTASGRVWREADIDYTSGFRNSKRILYSNDGLIYKTTDHYESFTRMR